MNEDFICKSCINCEALWCDENGFLSITCKGQEKNTTHKPGAMLLFCRDFNKETVATISKSEKPKKQEKANKGTVAPVAKVAPQVVPESNPKPTPAPEPVTPAAPAVEEKKPEQKDALQRARERVAQMTAANKEPEVKFIKGTAMTCCATCSNALRAIRGFTCKITCESVPSSGVCHKYKEGRPVN